MDENLRVGWVEQYTQGHMTTQSVAVFHNPANECSEYLDKHRESNSYLGSGKRSNEVHGCACQMFTSLPHFSIFSSALTPSELREGLCSPGCLRTQREKGTVNRNSCLRTKSRREGKGHELELSEGHR